MSTRAVYSFFDEYDTDTKWQIGGHHVYKHHDGYPEGAAHALSRALSSAWSFPRFEADEFAASFVVGNKTHSGGVRLCNTQTDACDIEYVYEIFQAKNGQLIIKAFNVNFWGVKAEKTPFFYGRLKDFIIQHGDEAAKKTWDTYAPESKHPVVKVCKDSEEYAEYQRLKEKFEPVVAL